MFERSPHSKNVISQRVNALPDASETSPPDQRESLLILIMLKEKNSPLSEYLDSVVNSLVKDTENRLSHLPDGGVVLSQNDIRSFISRSVIAGLTFAVNNLGEALLEHDIARISSLFDTPPDGQEIA